MPVLAVSRGPLFLYFRIAEVFFPTGKNIRTTNCYYAKCKLIGEYDSGYYRVVESFSYMEGSDYESTLVKTPAVSKKLRLYQAKCSFTGAGTNDFGSANMLFDIGKPFGKKSIQTKTNLPCLAGCNENDSNITFLRTLDDIYMLEDAHLMFGPFIVNVRSESIRWRCLPDKGGLD